MSSLESTLTLLQVALLCPLAILGFHRGWMVYLYFRGRRLERPKEDADTAPTPEAWPRVTVQLPIFNERYVAARLVECVARLDYPRDRLQIQVLDDSTDDTVEIVERAIRTLPDDLDIVQVRREDRRGFKAGALAAGTETASGEFLAVFDADFLPPADFLRRTIPHFADPKVGMVQSRWGHINPDSSLLTDIQATLLDGHFMVEHVARSRSGCYFNFNGTAGVFRRECIADAGGWQFDTLTEDMDLSYRAQMHGWSFVYLPDVVSPAELPTDMSAFLNQQHRWAKGSVQTGRKLLGRILRGPARALTKAEAVFHLMGNVAFPLLVGLILVALPLQLVRSLGDGQIPLWLAAIEGLPLFCATGSVVFYYGLAQHRVRRLNPASILRLPLVLAMGAGMSINNTAAVLSAFGSETGEFRRTPKRDAGNRSRSRSPIAYTSPRGALPFLEVGLGLWASTTSLLAFSIELPWTGVFHGLFALGLFWTGGLSLREGIRVTPSGRLRPSSAES